MNLRNPGVDSSTRREVGDRAKSGGPQAALVGAALPVVVMALRHHFRDRDDMLGPRALGITAARGSEASDDRPCVGPG